MANGDMKQRQRELLSLPGVQAVGMGEKTTAEQKIKGKPAVVVSVVKKKPISQLAPAEVIPEAINGIPTDVIETGKIRALSVHQDKHRPAPGGVSCGHEDITAGTLGMWVVKNGKNCILSNNHVIANSNAASIGDPILQPGPHDGGLPEDTIAQLSEFVPIAFIGGLSGCKTATLIGKILNFCCEVIGSRTRYQAIRIKGITNKVDAALAEAIDPVVVKKEILGIGPVMGWENPALGMRVIKSGRTTEITTGQIEQEDVMANVQYGAGKMAVFEGQVMAGPMSGSGDSGSVVLREDNRRAVGLLFAGSDKVTVINPFGLVVEALGFEV
jgi:hypothetical protein